MTEGPSTSDAPIMTAATAEVQTKSAFFRLPAVQALSDRSFQSLWLSNTLSTAASELRLMSQAWLVLSIGFSQVWVGIVNGLTAIPAIPLILYFGVLSDAKGGRWVLLVDRIALVIVTAIMAAVIITGSVQLWQIVILATVVGAVFAASMAPTQMLVPAFVERKNLQVANSLNSLSFSVARAVGPLIGGFLIAAFGVGSPFLAVVGMVIVCLALTLRIATVPGAGSGDISPTRRVWEGFAYARQNRAVGWLLVLSLSLLFGSGWTSVVPVYARNVLDVGEKGYGALLAAYAVGHAFSAIYIALVGGTKRKGVGMVIAVLVWTAGSIVFGFSHSFGLSLVLMVILGAMPPLWLSGIVTLLQVASDKEKMGRVMALFAVTIQMGGLGWILGTSLGQVIGNEYMIIMNSGLFALLHVAALLFLPEMRAKG